jgi:hypothetical protein
MDGRFILLTLAVVPLTASEDRFFAADTDTPCASTAFAAAGYRRQIDVRFREFDWIMSPLLQRQQPLALSGSGGCQEVTPIRSESSNNGPASRSRFLEDPSVGQRWW